MAPIAFLDYTAASLTGCARMEDPVGAAKLCAFLRGDNEAEGGAAEVAL